MGFISFRVLAVILYLGKVADVCFERSPLFLLALRKTGGAEGCSALEGCVLGESGELESSTLAAGLLSNCTAPGELEAPLWEDLCPDVHFRVILSRPQLFCFL